MSVHNYMLEDVLGALRAGVIFPLFVLAPGYVAAWFGNLFGFRGRTLSFRLALSAPLSISICPILTYLTGRFVSMTAVWTLFAITAVAFFFSASSGPETALSNPNSRRRRARGDPRCVAHNRTHLHG